LFSSHTPPPNTHIFSPLDPLVLFPAFRLQDRIQKVTLGDKGWVDVAKRVAKCKYIMEYSKLHGGDLPPVSFMTRLKSCFQPSKAMKMAIKLQEEEQDGPSPSSPSASPTVSKSKKSKK
jgi:hypothetical protein